MKGSAFSGNSVSTATFNVNPTVGNYLVAFVWGFKTGVTAGSVTCQDSFNGTANYTQVAFQGSTNNPGAFSCLFFSKVATTGGSFVVTANLTSLSSLTVCAAEFSGVAASSPQDGSAVTNTGAASTAANPGSTTFTSTSLVCCAISRDDSATGATFTTPTGYTRCDVETNGNSFEAGDSAYAVGPTMPTNPTWNSVAFAWTASMFALLAAGGAAALPNRQLFVGQSVPNAVSF